jgi:glycerophosphoryl diester phosphodiesterase
MDHFLELAGTDGVKDAISLMVTQAGGQRPWANRQVSPAHRVRAEALLRYEFLEQEHVAAWIAEIVHAFYNDPSFAALAWKNLRYGTAARQRLAEFVLRDQARWPWLRALDVRNVDPSPGPDAEMYVTNPTEAIASYAARLAAAPDAVDDYCKATGVIPEPPSFIRALLDTTKTAPADYDATIQALLATRPEDVRPPEARHIAVSFSMVLHDELTQVETTREAVHRAHRPRPVSRLDMPIRRALNMDLLGLAFSGGGIRSATFNLGVLQALSKAGLLRHCDYLSTVSGGGYIGSWLAAWIRRESVARAAIDAAAPAPHDPNAAAASTMADIERRLSPTRSPNPMDERVRPIRFLREYSNYLTPRTGFFSADTWTMLGIFIRNALLNQVIIIALFSAALLGPRLAFALTSAGAIGAWLPIGFWVIGGLVLVVNLRQLRPPRDSAELTVRPADRVRSVASRLTASLATPFGIHVGVVLPWLLAAATTAAALGQVYSLAQLDDARGALVLRAGALIAASLFVILMLGGTERCWRRAGTRSWSGSWIAAKLKATLAIVLAAVVSGAVAAGLTWVVLRALVAIADDSSLRWHALALGTAAMVSVLSFSIVAMLGMLGETFPDEHREWWSKLRTFVHVWAIGWLVGFVAAVYVPWGAHWMTSGEYSLRAGISALAAWIASTWFGVQKGRTAEDDKKQQHESGGRAAGMPATVLRLAAEAAPFVFIIGLVIGLSLAIDAILLAQADWPPFADAANYWRFATWAAVGDPADVLGVLSIGWTPIATAALLAIGLLFSWRVDINDFSLHHFYKNRLVRCYLGASHTRDRDADWFTGFDPRDDLRLREFDHANREWPRYPGPYPILNCALNLVGGQDLAWQERKSASFVFTPKYCGYDVDRAVLTKMHDPTPLAAPKTKASRWSSALMAVRNYLSPRLREDAYVPTAAYYRPGQGPLLGMAMAISGAAANPNMGRASSPALAFLMTVFNVRLGWWVGNPREPYGVKRPSPRIGLPYTALELFGGTDDRKRYVNLSDGGHFENLGVYELIRRGCRYIVACDAGQDGRFVAEDLGNLVRQCRTDFGVEIDIDIDRIRERTAEGFSHTHCVVGRIHYLNIPRRTVSGRLISEDDGPLLAGSRPAHEEGYLVYLKPSVTGDEAQDLLEYFRRIPEFPHQTTADQWFDESQFESYRKLGMHIGEQTFGRYQDDDTKPLGDVDQLFARLYRHWYPPSPTINANSTAHVLEYTRIMELIRANGDLRHLDHTMFEKWPDSGERVDARDEFYICNALIQLIENVYADLDLEDLWDHPHVQGWMSVFSRWAQQPAFRRTWRIAEWTYADRFRNFYNDRLRGRVIALPRAFVASHRGIGAGNGYRENTVAAFLDVIRQGASVIELDVWKSADDQLVVWHDAEMHGRPVAAMRLNEIRLRAPWVPTLAQCTAALHGVVQLDLELKVPGIERPVIDVLRAAPYTWRRRDFVLTSFHRSMIAAAHDCDHNVRTGLLVDTPELLDQAFDDFMELRSDFLGPAHALLDTWTPAGATDDDRRRAHEAAERLHRAVEDNVPLVPWSDPAAALTDQQRREREERLASLLCHQAVAGVITDDVPTAIKVKKTL